MAAQAPGRLSPVGEGAQGASGPEEVRPPRWLLFLAVSCLGISAITTQLVLMRELLNVLAGNEMIFGIILGNWFLLTGLGAMLGRTVGRLSRPIAVLVVAQVLVAVLPIVDVLAVRTLPGIVFVRGAEIGVTQAVVSCFVLLLPYCLITGYLLALACRLLASKKDAASIGQVYFLDVLGDIVGGLAFSFVLIHLLDHFSIVYIPAGLNLAFALAIAVYGGRTLLAGLVVGPAIAAVALVAALDLDALATRIEYAGQTVAFKGNSPYGKLVVTASAGQYNFIENGLPIFSTHDVVHVEEAAHYAMAQRPHARRVLLISGGISGTAKEILKYPAAEVDYVELDPMIIDVGRRFIPDSLADRRIHVHRTDGRLFVKRTDRRYDVVICNVPNPATSQLNRFYTVEFFAQAKRILSADGVLAVPLGGYENYLSEELARLIGSTHRTLRQEFRNVEILPGQRVFFLASDGELTRDISGRIEGMDIPTRWARRDYLDGVLTPDRFADVRRAISDDVPINRDFSPVLYYYHLLYWISQFKVRFGVLEGLLLLGLVVYLARIRPVPLAIFTTGFAASALEVILLVGFQILHGVVYHKVGIIVTMFMAGLAAGSFLANRGLDRLRRRDLAKVEFAVAAYAGLLPLALLGLARLTGPVGQVISAGVAFPLLTFILAVLVGMEFPLASKADFRGVAPTASRLYTADYIGACVGALLVSTLLIPLIGMFAVCMLVAAANLVSGVVVLFACRR